MSVLNQTGNWHRDFAQVGQLTGPDHHRHAFFDVAARFVPAYEFVLSRWQTVDGESAGRPGDVVKRVVENDPPGLLSRVDCAPDRDRNWFRQWKREVDNAVCTLAPGEIEDCSRLVIANRQRQDRMNPVIGLADSQCLPRANDSHPRFETASVKSNLHRGVGLPEGISRILRKRDDTPQINDDAGNATCSGICERKDALGETAGICWCSANSRLSRSRFAVQHESPGDRPGVVADLRFRDWRCSFVSGLAAEHNQQTGGKNR